MTLVVAYTEIQAWFSKRESCFDVIGPEAISLSGRILQSCVWFDEDVYGLKSGVLC